MGSYDFNSIMHYKLSNCISLRPGVNGSPGQRNGLSNGDIESIDKTYPIKVTFDDNSIDSPKGFDNNNQAVVAWTGTNLEHNINIMFSDNLKDWFNKIILSDTSLSAPSICSFQGNLYITWRETNSNQIIIIGYDGTNFFNKIALAETTFASPQLAVFNNSLYLSWTGTDSRLNLIDSFDGINWTNKLTLNETSPFAPAICDFNGSLALAWTGTDDNSSLNIALFNGSNFFSKVTLTENSNYSPQIFNTNGILNLVWTGTDPNHKLNSVKTSDNITFFEKITHNETSNFGVSGFSYNGRPILLWLGQDGNTSINLKPSYSDNFCSNDGGSVGGGGGCIFTSIVTNKLGEGDNSFELNLLRGFRDNNLGNNQNGKIIINDYKTVSPIILDKISSLPNKQAIYDQIWNKYISKGIEQVKLGDNETAILTYKKMIRNLKQKYL